MKLLNLTRVFVFKKALKAWKKETGFELLGSQALVLYAIGMNGSISFLALGRYLSSFYRGMSPNELQASIKLLVGYGLINVSVVGAAHYYSLTMSGGVALAKLEERCRNTRWDK